MKVFKFIFSILLGREYPLIQIKRGCKNVPYYSNWPDEIHLFLHDKFIGFYGLKSRKDYFKFLDAVLEHEFLHYLICSQISPKTSTALDSMHSWDSKKRKMRWGVHRRYSPEELKVFGTEVEQSPRKISKIFRLVLLSLESMGMIIYSHLGWVSTSLSGKLFWYGLTLFNAYLVWSLIKALRGKKHAK